jgi:hypothetical protein
MTRSSARFLARQQSGLHHKYRVAVGLESPFDDLSDDLGAADVAKAGAVQGLAFAAKL